MFLKDYQCSVCGQVQERFLDSSEEENTEVCEKCKAEPDKLKPVLSVFGKHLSWGKWSV